MARKFNWKIPLTYSGQHPIEANLVEWGVMVPMNILGPLDFFLFVPGPDFAKSVYCVYSDEPPEIKTEADRFYHQVRARCRKYSLKSDIVEKLLYFWSEIRWSVNALLETNVKKDCSDWKAFDKYWKEEERKLSELYKAYKFRESML